LGQLGQRGDVAVHAEQRLGHEQPAPGAAALGEVPLGRRRVAVGVDRHPGPRQPAAVDDAGVIELVRDDEVVGACERAENAQVGLVAARKQERRRAPDERRSSAR